MFQVVAHRKIITHPSAL